ncbi:UDP-N-acetylglucosamine 2-epimerase (hydrolyzing) [Halobacillus litoralis]|uniref:UDP-N-acetylglucosamine 2-epimerase (Hydrolyzing) n=1 Tax=Halobacillus litoralis TaxID=45668 RepID=A0A845F6U3_9BACI|nr:UDP-N-acetylglucosamine 2-epimerase (hydrolyzing) [Halobacillus litoralis]
MKKVCVLTATRAEYGLLKPLISRISNDSFVKENIVVTGAHLSPEFGLTYKDIESDGFDIDEKIEILVSADTPSSISKSMGLAMISFADYFARSKPDLLIVLGDRYETLAVCTAAMNERIPIAHLYGGETTEGAVDESVRHAITKLSYLHFTSTEEYRNRVIQLGEHPERVHTVGGLGVENILQSKFLSKDDLAESINFKLDKPFAMVTFHPVTLEDNQAEIQFQELLNVCKLYPQMKFIFTKANADAHGRIINQMIDKYVQDHDHAVAFTSLGLKRYLSGLKYAACVIGNSSSGLLEAPSFGIPTINIGDRQKGRIQAASVINCYPTTSDINRAMELALSEEFKVIAEKTINPYGDGNTSIKILDVVKEQLKESEITLKKKFYDYGG